jgi:hypothetical protein
MQGPDRLKQWLLRKTHTLLGVSPLRAQLASIDEQLRALAIGSIEAQRAIVDLMQATDRRLEQVAEADSHRLALLSGITAKLTALGEPLSERHDLQSPCVGATDAAPPGGQDAAPDLEALRALENQGLFILGCARSGTTILTRSLNRSPEVMLLEEPCSFLHESIGDFVGFFNHLHVSMGNRPMKGTYLPESRTSETGPIGTLLRLSGDYRYVGEKTAIGPHDYPLNWAQAYLDFQAKYFLHAKYLYILRTPLESIWSMHKMFSDRPIERLFEAWLRTIALSLDAYHVFPNSRLLFFDDLGQTMIDRLSDWLATPVPTMPGTFGRTYIYSALRPGDVPEPLRPYSDLCRQCTALYQDLRENFSNDEHIYRGPTTEWAYFDTVLRRIQSLIDNLSPSESGNPGQRLAA